MVLIKTVLIKTVLITMVLKKWVLRDLGQALNCDAKLIASDSLGWS